MFSKNFALVIGIGLSAAALTGCSNDDAGSAPGLTGASPMAKQADPSGNTILDIALELSESDTPEFTTLVAAVLAADPSVAEELGARGKRTVFAPTDAAFQALFDNPDFPYTPAELLGNTELLTTVLGYHLVPGERLSGDVLESSQIRMSAGGFIYPIVEGGMPYLKDGSSITPNAGLVLSLIDIEASNGVIHVIDQVLLP